MKKWLIMMSIFFVHPVIAVSTTVSDDFSVLRARLRQINSFYATFFQKITSSEGYIIQEGKGELWVQRPSLFRWHAISPDENLIISDGNLLWYYNPFIEQVTISFLKNVISSTPFFMLITYNNIADWTKYQVKQEGDNFFIVPKSSNTSNIKKCVMKVIDNGTIEEITLIDQDGQRSDYKFFIQNNTQSEDIDTYKFILPHGVTIDDQR